MKIDASAEHQPAWPSAHPDPAGVPSLQDWINDGYGVNLARTTRQMAVGAGTKLGWAGLGWAEWSQGGGETAARAGHDAADDGELKLVGTEAMSTAFANPSISSDSPLLMIQTGHKSSNPDALNRSDDLPPLGGEIVETSCSLQAGREDQPVSHESLASILQLVGGNIRSDQVIGESALEVQHVAVQDQSR